MTSPQLLSPDQGDILPFPGRRGRGVRVAVIDSGVNSRHPHIGRVAGGVSVSGAAGIVEDSYLDFLGHGTAVMAAIQEKAPDAEYFAVKLFHAALRTTVECVLRAMEWAIENRMDVINLSLGTRNPDHRGRLMEVTARAIEQGVAVVSARDMDGQCCFPGCLPGVFGVSLDWDCDRSRYRFGQVPGGLVLHASGYPRSLPGMTRERNLHGISFAVANMAGFIARGCEGLSPRSPETIRGALQVEATRLNSRPAR